MNWEGLSRQVFVAYVGLRTSGKTEENHDNPQSAQSMVGRNIVPNVSNKIGNMCIL